MNAAPRINIPCTTVDDWLQHHAVTKCPSGHALGLSSLEKQFGTTAKDAGGWVQQIKQQQSNEVLAHKQKRLHIRNKSAK